MLYRMVSRFLARRFSRMLTPIKPEDSLINIAQSNSLFSVTGKKKKTGATPNYLVSSGVWSALVVLDLFLLGEALELESQRDGLVMLEMQSSSKGAAGLFIINVMFTLTRNHCSPREGGGERRLTYENDEI